VKSTSIFILLSLSASILFAQIEETTQDNQTSFALKFGPNLTYSTIEKSLSIGGLWGAEVDHFFINQRRGLSFGLYYSVIHVGRRDDFTVPSEAREYRVLETAFAFNSQPFKRSSNFRLKIGVMHGLILEDSGPNDGYNLFEILYGFEYIIPTDTSLHASIGMDYRTYILAKDRFGLNITNVLFFKAGMKN